MRFDIVTIFPDYFQGPLHFGIVRRAQDAGLLAVAVMDLRDFTRDKHRTVDDRPFGGGPGMVLKPEPLFAAVESVRSAAPNTRVVLLSPQGARFTQDSARRYAGLERVLLICGRYEGVDERVSAALADEELSVGDFVLSGGEPAAAVVVDAVARLLPGALGNEESAARESFAGPSLLEGPQYTRPAEFRGMAVPEVLLSGHHAEVERWRRKKALEKTLHYRPDLLDRATLAGDDRELLAEIFAERRPKS
jgi:tRNA (guanine37-N1)-methyltransferase